MISTPSPSKAALDVAIKEFKRSVEITRDVRFQANLRLVSRSRASSYIIALLSTYVIALSLVPNIMFLANYQSQLLLACSIVLSVFVIFTSLIDGAQNFYHHGEMLHACARKVATIYHELKLIDTAGDLAQATAAFIELQERYKLALDECPVNHDNVDYYTEMANKPHLFPDNFPNWPRFCVVFLE